MTRATLLPGREAVSSGAPHATPAAAAGAGVTELVVADIGGTHARFALARAGAEGVALGAPAVFRTADFPTLEAAWAAFAEQAGGTLPPAAALAVAGPVGGAELRFTNNPWVVRPAALARALGLERLLLVNDFGAVAHAVGVLPPGDLAHLAGPSGGLGEARLVSVVGPGTGLGVALAVRGPAGLAVVETEGGHLGFAAVDAREDALLARLRARFGRVSAERIVAGPGLRLLCEALAAEENRPADLPDDRALWAAALAGTDPLATAALDWWCRCLGAFAGDIALAHGAEAVVVAGGLGLRLAGHLAGSGFAERFVAKGRFAPRLREVPVRLVTHPEPGLLGAAVAFRQQAGGVAEVLVRPV